MNQDSTNEATAPALQVRGVVKTFGSFTALHGVDLTVMPGEVVGLLGENGAGKSTLIKVLAGAHLADSGEVLINGRNAEVSVPADAIKAGIATVYQHSMLVGTLTVAENLVMGQREGHRWVTQSDMRRRAQKMCDDLGIPLPVSSLAEDLSVADQQLVEIVKAAHDAGSLVILDEPTAALEAHEVEQLFRVIRTLKARGLGLIYVSHRLDEIPVICDRVEVFRDGRNVGGLEKDDCVPEKIIPLLVGRDVEAAFPDLNVPADREVLTVTRLATRDTEPVSFTVRAGEVVGLTGAAGAGHREVARAIFGAERIRSGEVRIDGAKIPGSPAGAAEAGVAYVSGDRVREGVFPQQSVWRNVASAAMRKVSPAFGIIRRREEKHLGLEGIRKFGVKCSSPDQPITTLSGGNQQKALLARWAMIGPKLLILDEPTLGVDVGARREIYDHIAEMAHQGMGILMVSSDHVELQGMSHRVLVFSQGHAVAHMTGEEATESAILHARAVGTPLDTAAMSL